MSQCPYTNLLDPQLFAEGYHHEKLGEVRRGSGGVAKIDDPITGVPYWAILTRETCDFVSKHPDIFSSQARTAIPHEFPAPRLF